nr:sugar phosphate isomerase/epimerase family protein [Paenibacillus hamazuiensis]
MRRCRTAGFQVLDVSFCHAIFGKTELVKDDWEKQMYEIRNEAESLGIEFSQSHPVFLPGHPEDHPADKRQLYREMMERSIIASSILGVKWAALHPIEAKKTEAAFDLEANIKANFEHFAPVVELAIKHNVGVAFENMIERASSKRRFCSHAGELAALVDAYNDRAVGACWDFGHGNFLYKDQRFALRTLGGRLKSTHVNDNYGQEDEHMFPFHGNVDWAAIMPVLTEIGYEGDFSFETHNEFDRLPESIKDTLAKTGYEIGMYCLSLA